jgi:hypothetical protein
MFYSLKRIGRPRPRAPLFRAKKAGVMQSSTVVRARNFCRRHAVDANDQVERRERGEDKEVDMRK